MKVFLAMISYYFLGNVRAWVLPSHVGHDNRRSATMRLKAAVGIFYGTSTGSTQEVANKIYQAFGSAVAAPPIDVDTLDSEGSSLGKAFGQHGALIVGTPTWNTGADTARSGTGWDQLYYGVAVQQNILEGKKVAVFGLGDQISYSENFADATGELYDTFESVGCLMMGAWPQDGYEHEESKSIRNGKFCGLILDMVNQEELTDERVKRWVAQLIREGILGDGKAVPGGTGVAPIMAQTILQVNAGVEELEEQSNLLDESIGSHSSGGFTPYHNKEKGKTMWVSSDGRSSFVTIKSGSVGGGLASRFSP